MTNTFISIDWGGSELKGAVISNKRLLGFIRQGSANIRLLSEEALFQAASMLNTAILRQTSEKFTALISAAGANDKGAVSRLKSAFLRAMPNLAEIEVYADYEANHAACFGFDSGILSINGTGSAIYAKLDNKEFKMGGWGYLLDKTPSGAYFGKELSEGVLRFLEGETKFKEYSDAWVEFTGQKPTKSLVLNELYGTKEQQKILGIRGQMLSIAAEHGSEMAMKAILESSEQLILQISKLIKQSGVNKADFCGFGALWLKCPVFVRAFKSLANGVGLPVKIKEPKNKSELGALLLYSRSNSGIQGNILPEVNL